MNKDFKEFLGIIIIIALIFIATGSISNFTSSKVNGESVDNFKIYSRDINTDEEVIVETFGFDSLVQTVDERLRVIAQKLSEKEFNSLPIELVEIKNIDGKKVAIFNLKENEENLSETDWSKYKNPSWANNFFQGSAGGSWTCYTLQTTMLQPDYDGEWIDGVSFLYNGEENKCFQHIEGLDSIKYR